MLRQRKCAASQVWKLLRELGAHFQDSYIHVGGDEVPLGCWEVRAGFRDQDCRNKLVAAAAVMECTEFAVCSAVCVCCPLIAAVLD